MTEEEEKLNEILWEVSFRHVFKRFGEKADIKLQPEKQCDQQQKSKIATAA